MNDYIFVYKLVSQQNNAQHINVKVIKAIDSEKADAEAESFLKTLNKVSEDNKSTDRWKYVLLQNFNECEVLQSKKV